jgi:hypothetical protein
MSDRNAFDPMELARRWVSEWEKLSNEHGTELLAKPEVAKAIQGLSSSALSVQAAANEATGRLLAAANLPSKGDIDALGQRLAAVEAALGRIEKHLAPNDPAPTRPAVQRTRKPPAR